jgi:hypothetical protein
MILFDCNSIIDILKLIYHPNKLLTYNWLHHSIIWDTFNPYLSNINTNS